MTTGCCQRLQLQETFDHVISYASIYHLEKDEQCHWAEQSSLGEKNSKQCSKVVAVCMMKKKRQKLQLIMLMAMFVLLVPALCLLITSVKKREFVCGSA